MLGSGLRGCVALDSVNVDGLARANYGEQPLGSVGLGPGWPGGGVGVVFSTPPLMIVRRVKLSRKSRTAISRFERGIKDHSDATRCYDDLGVRYKMMLTETTAEACRNLLAELNLG